jgi:hypothetical protein
MIWLLVVLSILSAILYSATLQYTGRRQLDQRERQVQADLLARAGIEMAAARLLADPANYTGETADLFANGHVSVTVRAVDKSGNFELISEGRYETPGAKVTRSQTRRFRRVVEEGRARLERVE